MQEQISSPNPDVETANTAPLLPGVDPASVTNGTANQRKSVPQQEDAPDGEPETPQEPTDESFTELDPSTLSAENQTAYKNMLTDYKRKTQALAEQRRATETQLQESREAAQKAALYDQISSDEGFVRYWNTLSQGTGGQTPTAQPEGTTNPMSDLSDEEFADAFTSKDKFMKLVSRMNEGEKAKFSQELSQTNSQLRVETANRFVKEFKTRPEYADFDKLDKHKFITYQVQLHKPSPNSTERDWEKLLKTSYQNAKQVRDDIWNEGYQAGLQRLKAKANNISEPPSVSAGPIASGVDPKKLTGTEAVDMARRGIRVSQEW